MTARNWHVTATREILSLQRMEAFSGRLEAISALCSSVNCCLSARSLWNIHLVSISEHLLTGSLWCTGEKDCQSAPYVTSTGWVERPWLHLFVLWRVQPFGRNITRGVVGFSFFQALRTIIVCVMYCNWKHRGSQLSSILAFQLTCVSNGFMSSVISLWHPFNSPFAVRVLFSPLIELLNYCFIIYC